MGERKPKILLCVTGCAQAEHTVKFTSNLLNHPDYGSHEVTVVATEPALQFFEKEEVQKLTGRPVFVYHSDATEEFKVPHIDLAKWADLVLVYPASANTLAKCAHGFTDSLVAVTVMAARCPVYFGPTMNDLMFESKVLQQNIKKLQSLGHQIIGRTPTQVWIHSDQKWVEKLFCSEAMALDAVDKALIHD